GVDRGAAARVDLEVDVGGGVAGGAGLAVVGDQLAGPHPRAGPDGVAGQVGVEVLDAVEFLMVVKAGSWGQAGRWDGRHRGALGDSLLDALVPPALAGGGVRV